MTKLEQNNLDAQIKLMNDILSNYRNIIYHVTENGKKLVEQLRTRKINESDKDNKTVTISLDSFDKIWDIACNLQDEDRHENLGILAKNSVPDNKSKIEILKLLQKP